MEIVVVVGVDLVKLVFQMYGVDESGVVVLCRCVLWGQFVKLFIKLLLCLVGMEVCLFLYYWVRQLMVLGYEVKLMLVQYVKFYFKCGKNDVVDVEVICEVVIWFIMCFVGVKMFEQQVVMMLYWVRKILICQCMQLINVLCVYFVEFGIMVLVGWIGFDCFFVVVVDFNDDCLFVQVCESFVVFVSQLEMVKEQIFDNDWWIMVDVCKSEVGCCLMKILGIGFLFVSVIFVLVVDLVMFFNGRSLLVWIGFILCQNLSGGKEWFGLIIKVGNIYLCELLVVGVMVVVCYVQCSSVKWFWLGQLFECKKFKVVVVVLVNKNVWIIWVMMIRGESYCEMQVV